MLAKRSLRNSWWALVALGAAGSAVIATAPARAVPGSPQPAHLAALPSGRRPPRGMVAPAESGLLSVAYGAPAWLVCRLASVTVRPRREDDAGRLRRGDGRRVLEVPIAEPARAVFVRVAGRVEFERADIGFGDSTVEHVEAFGVERGPGIYRLAGFRTIRGVDWVRLVLRARSRAARVEVLIERAGRPEPGTGLERPA